MTALPCPPTRRAAIIEAARRAFSGGSYESAGLREIAAAAGLDTGHVVREFGSKEALFEAALVCALEARPRVDPEQWAADLAEELVDGEASHHTEAFKLFAYSAASPTVCDIVRAHAGGLEARIAEVLEAGSDLRLRTWLSVAIILGLTISRWLLNLMPVSGEDARLARGYVAEMLEALRSPDSQGDPGPRRLGASATRAAILKAADKEFSRLGYDHATVRGIATVAEVDPALVIRYFDSKESLFRDVLKAHFRNIDELTPGELILDFVLMHGAENEPNQIDLTVRSASSAVAREILREDIQARFHAPLAARLAGPDAMLRANLITALVMGMFFCRSVINVESSRTGRSQTAYLRALLARWL